MRCTTAAAIALTLVLASAAEAANFCVSLGGGHAVASDFIVPTKGICTAFNGFYSNLPGVLLAGDLCRSSDGTTFLFNLFTQVNGMPDSIVGTWSSTNGKGSGKECTSASANCLTFDVAVTRCPGNVPIPHNAPGFEAESSSSFLTQEP